MSAVLEIQPAHQAGGRWSKGARVISLNRLRLDLSIGVLTHEYREPQPVLIEAALKLGGQDIMPASDSMSEVLDYRELRRVVIDACTGAHTHLVETLAGRILLRLLDIPQAIGARVCITKPLAFDDCDVSVEVQAGDW